MNNAAHQGLRDAFGGQAVCEEALTEKERDFMEPTAIHRVILMITRLRPS
ncbi:MULTISPECIES: hypothetical protein [Clostridia]|nr:MULTISPECIES: hypothetical protein [Clostridia]